MIDYFHGRLDAEAADRMQEHLVQCRHCAGVVLDLDGFNQPAVSPPEDPTAAHFVARASLQQRRGDRWRMTAGLAALLLVAAALPLGLGPLVQRQSAAGGGQAGPSPEVNFLIVSLNPRAAHRGSSEAGRLELTPGRRLVGLVLATEELPAGGEFALAVVDPRGHDRLTLRGLQPTPTGIFSLALPTSFLQPGRWRLRLFRVDGRMLVPIEDYDLLVTLPGAGGGRPEPAP